MHMGGLGEEQQHSVPVTGGSVALTGPSVPLTGGPFPLRASLNCLIVGLGPGCQGFGVSLRILDPSSRNRYRRKIFWN